MTNMFQGFEVLIIKEYSIWIKCGLKEKKNC